MITAMELRRIFYNIEVEIHTFGAPRIGDVQLARHINNKIPNIYRVIHNKDIVPHLPPDLPEFDYHHSAYEIFWNSDFTSYKTCSDTGEDKSCSNQYFPNYTTGDHDTYFIKISSPQCWFLIISLSIISKKQVLILNLHWWGICLASSCFWQQQVPINWSTNPPQAITSLPLSK